VTASTGTAIKFCPGYQVFVSGYYRIRSVWRFSFYRGMHSGIHQVVLPSTWGNIGTDLSHSQSEVTKSTNNRNRNSNSYS